MTLDEAIKHAEEVAEEWENACEHYEIAGVNANHKCAEEHRQLAEWLKELKRLRKQTRWTPCGERLPEDLEEVNVTWVNHAPEQYYDFVKDKHFTGSAVYYKGLWYWYSSTCVDILAEYGRNEMDKIDDGIEVVAWMSLPKPYLEGEE